ALFLGLVDYSSAAFLKAFFQYLGLIPSTKSEIDNLFSFLMKYNIGPLCIFLAIIGFLKGFTLFLSEYVAASIEEVTRSRLRLLAVHDILYARRSRLLDPSIHQTFFSEAITKAALFAKFLTYTFIYLFQVLFISAGLLYISWQAYLSGLAFLVLVGMTQKKITVTVREQSKNLPYFVKTVSASISRITKNYVAVRTLGTETFEHQTSERAIKNYEKVALSSFALNTFSGSIPIVAGILIISVLLYLFSGVLHVQSSLLGPFLFLFVRLAQSISLVLLHFGNSSNYAAQAHILEEILPAAAFADEGFYKKRESRTESSLEYAPSLQILNLNYHYGDNKKIFSSLNLEIPAGACLGIEGESGAGKSTLIYLLMGLDPASEGSVLWNGENAIEFIPKYRHHIAYVGPVPYLFEGTLRENLLYGNKNSIEISDSFIEEALKKANALNFLLERKVGLNSLIGEGALLFSTGEQQRLALARAFLRNPKLIILDEATSNLDAGTEKIICDILNEMSGTTRIIVSHRPNPLRICNFHLNLKKENHASSYENMHSCRQ
ncbi:MAG: ABC transporter ATP-binding protein, partial [Chryseobacterium sp.]